MMMTALLSRKWNRFCRWASTHAFVAYGRGATIVAFAGTDPLVLANWITDFDVYIDRKTDTTRGYNSAVAAVWPRIKALAEKSVLRAGKLIIAGHSLGGALAVLTANRFARARRVVQCVCTFGMPRPGDPAFAAEYGELGDRTYRLVYQNDIAPTVRPSWLQFRHVGRFLRDSGKFDGRNLAPDCTSDAPQFVRGIGQQLRDFLHSPLSSVIEPLDRLKLAAAMFLGIAPGKRTDPAGIAIELLPPVLRDHMLDRYIGALG